MSAGEEAIDLTSVLRGFAREYQSRGVPPPHILLVGRDEAQNASIGQDFARELGLEFVRKDAARIDSTVDLTVLLPGKRVAFLDNLHLLKRSLSEKLARDLHSGDWEITIGTGPAARVHKMDLKDVTIIATCPTKYDCPASLLKQFRCILPVIPYSRQDLLSLLEKEAWKDRISLQPDAADLLLRCGEGRADLLLSRFRRLVKVIAQVGTTNQPELTKQEVLEALARLRIDVPSEIHRPESFNLSALSGEEFERVIKSLLIEMGFQAELTKVTGDGGVDIIATLDRPFSGGRYLFQCKRYAMDNLVGAPAVRDFYGAVVADRAIKGIIITTSDFTVQAKEFAAQTAIELVNLPRLQQLFEDSGLNQYI